MSGPQCLQFNKTIPKYWTSMPPIHQKDPVQLGLNASKNLGSWKYWKQHILRTSHPGSHSIKPVNWIAILAVTQSNQSTGLPSWQSLNQTCQLDSHPGSHSIKPVNWTAILAATQSIQSTGQPSWQPLKQTSQ